MRTTLTSVASLAMAITICHLCMADEGKKNVTKTIKVTVIIRGVHCDRDVKAFRSALKSMKGIKFDATKIEKGKKPKYFTEPFVVEILDTRKTHLGAIAKTVSDAQTPHREEFPPKLNLVLFTPERITERAVMELRSELREVNGVEVLQPGGLGGIPNKGRIWVQLEDVGGAELDPIVKAARKADENIDYKQPD